jgi:uncharacterized protein YdiU (UPF0061 family)
MNQVNPKYVLRNYMSQLAKGLKRDYSLIEELHLLLKNPYQDQDEYHKWFAKGQIGLEKIGAPCCPAVLKMN